MGNRVPLNSADTSAKFIPFIKVGPRLCHVLAIGGSWFGVLLQSQIRILAKELHILVISWEFLHTGGVITRDTLCLPN